MKEFMKKEFLEVAMLTVGVFIVVLISLMIFGGVANAIPVLNDGQTVGMQYNGSNESYGKYVNSGKFLFAEGGNNSNTDVEASIEAHFNYQADDFHLFEIPVIWSPTNIETGIWDVPNGNVLSFYAVKAGNGYAMYEVVPADVSGSWSTYDLWNSGLYNNGDSLEISHFTGYDSKVNPNPVPEPCTLILMGSGLLGLVGYKKRTRKSNS